MCLSTAGSRRILLQSIETAPSGSRSQRHCRGAGNQGANRGLRSCGEFPAMWHETGGPLFADHFLIPCEHAYPCWDPALSLAYSRRERKHGRRGNHCATGCVGTVVQCAIGTALSMYMKLLSTRPVSLHTPWQPQFQVCIPLKKHPLGRCGVSCGSQGRQTPHGACWQPAFS